MDLRFNYDHIRDQIDQSNFGENLPENLVNDIKRRMNQHIDCILEYEQKKKEIEGIIKEQRMALKKLAEDWEV